MLIFSKKALISVCGISAVVLTIWLSNNPIIERDKAPQIEPSKIASEKEQTNEVVQSSLHQTVEKTTEEPNIKVNISLQPGSNLSDALAAENILKNQINAVSESLKDVINLRKLKPGQRIELSLQETDDGSATFNLDKLVLVASTDRLVVAQKTKQDQFETTFQEIEHSSELVFASGEIANSFYASAKKERVPNSILMDTFSTLSHAIDFQRDINKGDGFILGYESYDDKEYGGTHPGRLMYVSMSLNEREVSYFRYKTDGGYSGFFDTDGKSIDTSLLKTPVGGGRLSSLYGKRKHPVLSYARMHKGLDFAAPTGTPIFAAGDGVVTARKRNGSFGKYIRINHNNDYATAYAHLNKYADNLAVGSRVQQGDIIGYVGTTGLTSGPNLHYEVIYRGKQINPLTVKLPSRLVLQGEEFERFEQAKNNLLVEYKLKSHFKYKMSKLGISSDTYGKS